MQRNSMQIPYGVFNFKTIRNEGLYYVDKTGFIPLLEQAGRFLFFVRPRRFGKSLMANMLRCYYDVAEKDNYREWFKSFKAAFDRIYMTGVSPVTMDDLTSGFNIATNISQESDFNSMLGFSEEEVLRIYTDFKGVGRYTEGDPAKWVQSFKPWYDGYCFILSGAQLLWIPE